LALLKAAKHVDLTQPTKFQLMINRADGGAGEPSPPACAGRPEIIGRKTYTDSY